MGCCMCSSCCLSSKGPEMPESVIEKMGPTIVNENGFRIVTRLEKGNVSKPDFLWFYIPGVGAHSWSDWTIGNLIKTANENNGWWIGMDKQGNGYSDGYRNYIEDFTLVTRDASSLIKRLYEYSEVDSSTPIYILGQSMGGLLATIFALEWQSNRNLIPGNFKGLILFAPNLAAATIAPGKCVQCLLANLVLPICPLYRIAPSGGGPETSYTDQEIIQKVLNDPLHITLIPLALGYAFLQAWEKIPPRLKEIQIPFYVVHGDGDLVCPVEGTERLLADCQTPENLRGCIIPEKYMHVTTAEATFCEVCAPKIVEWMNSVPDNWQENIKFDGGANEKQSS